MSPFRSDVDPTDRLPSLADFLSGLAGAASVAAGAAEEDVLALSEIRIELPIELNLLEERGVWQLDGAPPTQKIETAVMPVWHRVRLRVSADNGERNLDPLES